MNHAAYSELVQSKTISKNIASVCVFVQRKDPARPHCNTAANTTLFSERVPTSVVKVI